MGPLFYAYGPFVLCLQALCFMPTGPLFYAYGPFVLLLLLYAVLTVSLMICYLCYPVIQLVIWILISNSLSLDRDGDRDVERMTG